MSTEERRNSRVHRRRLAYAAGVAVLAYVAVAYILMPSAWKWVIWRRPVLAELPNITHTRAGIPGDPLNVSLTGSKEEMRQVFQTAGWFPADPLSLRSRLEIAEATVLKRPYDDAPVSDLYWNGRKEDLAFEQPVGDNPRQRHHVRFWNSGLTDAEGRPVWIGSATFDDRVGLSHTTGQITHHIDADIDAERDHLFHDLQQTGRLAKFAIEAGYHQTREGRNGGGDPWRTDGGLYRAEIAPAASVGAK